jgi:uncharacterized membrane protein YtjA (UPF0391 family)
VGPAERAAILALVMALSGFGGIASAFADIALILFVIALVLFVVFLVLGVMAARRIT